MNESADWMKYYGPRSDDSEKYDRIERVFMKGQLLFDGPGNVEPDMLKYLEVLTKALKKYQERDAERKGVWRRGGVKGQVHDAYAKSERLFFQALHHNRVPIEDDLIDIINYATFALMLMQESEEERPEPGYSREGFDDEEINRRTLNGAWPW